MGASHGNFFKFPRTGHIFGSVGTSDDKHFDYDESMEIVNSDGLVIEEKIDGSNCGLHFHDGHLVLQNRGHEIELGEHPQFDLLKPWAMTLQTDLYEVLEDRYIMFGEWMYAQHTLLYTRLPHYFMEFDVYDKETGLFLDTPTRHEMLSGLVHSVPVIHVSAVANEKQLRKYINRSLYCDELAEGLYLKVEKDGYVQKRAKYVRPDFIQQVTNSDHWRNKPIVVNGLRKGADLWQFN